MAALLDKGVLLVADPSLMDPNFETTVVLLCAHSKEGSLGLVLNRSTQLTLDQLLPEESYFRQQPLPVSWGGPVGLDRLNVLHGGRKGGPESAEVIEGVQFGGQLPVLEEVHLTGAPLRFLVGYSGWDSGQLESELEEGAWRVMAGRRPVIFDDDPETLWQRVIATQDPGLTFLRDLPPDPWKE